MVEKLVRAAIVYRQHGFEDDARKTLGLADELLKRGVPWDLEEERIFYHPKFVYFPDESRIMGKSGQKLELTPTENRILELLADNVSRVVSYPNFSIALGIPGKFSKAIASLLKQHISYLRDKIEPESHGLKNRGKHSIIRTIEGEGYMLVHPGVKQAKLDF